MALVVISRLLVLSFQEFGFEILEISCVGACPISVLTGLWCRISAGLGKLLESGVTLICNSACVQSGFSVVHLDNICLSICIILSFCPLLWA